MEDSHLAGEQGRSTPQISKTRWMAPLVARGRAVWHVLLPPLAPLAAPPRRMARRGLVGVAVIMVTYTAILFAYMFRLHNGEGTHGEDLGIMDQVLWNTAHGNFWRQTICNPVSDLNCLGNVSRWGIHFEPSMLLLVPFYWFGGGPHVLQFVQVAGVALGALPAYWLGSRRLGHIAWGWSLALVYLLMPVLYSAVTTDFHMVTLAAPALLFALYFLYTQNDRGLIIACIFAIGTKEQVALDVLMLGFAVVVLQRRYRLGLALGGLAIGWAVVALSVMHFASPLGASPTAVRYDGLGATLARVPELLLDPTRRAYLGKLLLNAGGVGIFAPWALLLALPSILLNALSNTPAQYSGQHQYNADIAPFLLVALLEGTVAVMALGARLRPWLVGQRARLLQAPALVGQSVRLVRGFVLAGLLVGVTLGGAGVTQAAGARAQYIVQTWPSPSAHTKLLPIVLGMVPDDAAVAAQAELVPHLSHRALIYQFPDGIAEADYIVLDTKSDFYPEPSWAQYRDDVQSLVHDPQYILLYDDDGYLLLLNQTPVDIVSAP